MLSSTTRAFGSPLRYVQGQGEFGRLPLYTAPYGNACVIIDGFLYQDLNARLEKAYAESDAKFVSISFNGECCEEEVERIGKIARENGAAVIVGAGGGKTMDTAKICADEMGLPVIIAPSSASTDAPVSEIAVVYKPDGEYIGSRKMKKNADLVLVDTEIIVKAPRRLFVAGMGDALATWLEAQACECSDSPNYIGSGMRRCKAGMAIAKASWDILFEDGEKALMALDSGVRVGVRFNADANNFAEIRKLERIFSEAGYSESKLFSFNTAMLNDENKDSDRADISYVSREEFNRMYSDSGLDIPHQDYGLYSKILTAIRNKTCIRFHSVFCGVQSGSYILDPYGDIYTCWETVGKPEYVIGKYSPETAWNDSIRNWQDRNTGNTPKCSCCKYALLCGGGCLAKALKFGGSFSASYCDGYSDIVRLSVNRAYDSAAKAGIIKFQ